jgi:hypothetical protein
VRNFFIKFPCLDLVHLHELALLVCLRIFALLDVELITLLRSTHLVSSTASPTTRSLHGIEVVVSKAEAILPFSIRPSQVTS